MAIHLGEMVKRGHVRTEIGVDLDGAIATGDRTGRATVENISPGGARIITRVPLLLGQPIILSIGNLGTADGRVAWTNRYIVGMRFDHEVDTIADLLLAVAIY